MQPRLTDRARLEHNRRRALADPALFLHEAALAEVEERLAMVNRPFTDAAVVTAFPDLWAAAHPGARVVPDTDALDLEPGAHDLVIHAMALHWADDPVGQLVQCRRALRPDGLLLAILPGGRTLHELRAVLSDVEVRLRGGLSPRVLPMADIRDLGGLLQRSGLALPVTDSVSLKATYPSARALMRDLRAMGEGNALVDRDRRPLNRLFFDETDAVYARTHPAGPGRIEATYELICLTGWAPDENQPKPLRPGSAEKRLSDALGTHEIPAGDPLSDTND